MCFRQGKGGRGMSVAIKIARRRFSRCRRFGKWRRRIPRQFTIGGGGGRTPREVFSMHHCFVPLRDASVDLFQRIAPENAVVPSCLVAVHDVRIGGGGKARKWRGVHRRMQRVDPPKAIGRSLLLCARLHGRSGDAGSGAGDAGLPPVGLRRATPEGHAYRHESGDKHRRCRRVGRRGGGHGKRRQSNEGRSTWYLIDGESLWGIQTCLWPAVRAHLRSNRL